MNKKEFNKRIDQIVDEFDVDGYEDMDTCVKNVSEKVSNKFIESLGLNPDESDEEIDKLFDDNVLNDYVNYRLAILTIFSKLDNEMIKGIDDDCRGDLSFLIKNIYDFCNKNQDKISKEYLNNILEFIGKTGVRFDNKYKNTDTFNYINDIITLVNSAPEQNYTYLVDEGRKFYKFDDKAKLAVYSFDNILKLEIDLYSFVNDLLFINNEEFIKKYILDNTLYIDSLYIINYLLNDFPYIFKIERFRTRIKSMLNNSGFDKDNIFDTIGTILSAPLFRKVAYAIEYKDVVNKTNHLINNEKIRS